MRRGKEGRLDERGVGRAAPPGEGLRDECADAADDAVCGGVLASWVEVMGWLGLTAVVVAAVVLRVGKHVYGADVEVGHGDGFADGEEGMEGSGKRRDGTGHYIPLSNERLSAGSRK